MRVRSPPPLFFIALIVFEQRHTKPMIQLHGTPVRHGHPDLPLRNDHLHATTPTNASIYATVSSTTTLNPTLAHKLFPE